MAIRDKDQIGTGIRALTVDASGNHGNVTGILYNPSTSFASFISSLGSSRYHLIIGSAISITDDLTIPSTISMEAFGPFITISATKTLTINGAFTAGNFQVFAGSGRAVFGFGSVQRVNAKWFGAVGDASNDDTAALQKAIDCLVGTRTGSDNGSAANYIRKVYLPGGYYKVTDELLIDRNALIFEGDGRQNTFIYPLFTTDVVLNLSGYITLVNGDIGRTITSLTTQLPMLGSSSFEGAIVSDVGKTVLGSTSGAQGRLVRYSNNGVAPFWEVVMLSGTFVDGEDITIPTGTPHGGSVSVSHGTIDGNVLNITNVAKIRSFNNSTRTWTVLIEGAADGYFWTSADVTVSGLAGTARVSADAADVSDSVLRVSASGQQREYVTIRDVGFAFGSGGRFAAVDIFSAPNTQLESVYVDNPYIAVRGGECWNTQVSNCNFVRCRRAGFFGSNDSNATCFLNTTITGADAIESRCIYLESSYGTSVKGGAYEDGWYNIELQAGNYSFDGYMESSNEGSFAITGNDTILSILNCNSQTVGKCFVRTIAGGSTTIINNAIIFDSPDVEYLFKTVSGAIIKYGGITTDDPDIAPGGSKFQDGGGMVASFASNNDNRGNAIGLSGLPADDVTLRITELNGPNISTSQDALEVVPNFRTSASSQSNAIYVRYKKNSTFSQLIGRAIHVAANVNGTNTTTVCGIDIDDQTGGGTNYAIRTAAGLVQFGTLTASQVVFTDSNKNLVSVATTGTGSVVLAASPTLTGTISAAAANFSGTVNLAGLTATRAVFTDGSKNLVSNTLTGTGNVVMSTSPRFTQNVGIGVNASADTAINIGGTLTTGTGQYGLLVAPTMNASATTEAAAVWCQVITANSSFTCTSAYGIYISSGSKGAASTITTLYGLRIRSQSAGATNYAIFTEDGLVKFGDQLQLTASSTARASLNLPSGTAPTSPVSGDMWYDGTNLKFRDGGTTRTVTWV